MVQHVDRRRWVVPAVAAVVLVAAAGAGLLLREWSASGAAGGGVPERATAVSAPAEEPGSRTVELREDVAAHPAAQQVRAVLQNHFDAINNADYRLWTRTVTVERARLTSSRAWSEQYRTTLDGDVVVHRLEPRLGGGLVALLSFTSVQDPTDAPPDLPVRCLRWQVTYPLIPAGEGLLLGLSAPNASLRAPCSEVGSP